MNRKIILVIFGILSMFFGIGTLSVANATTYYVDVVKGDDNNPGTQEEPFKTIGKGIGVSIDGDTVYCAPGTYIEKVTITKRIALVGSSAETTIIDVSSFAGDKNVVVFSGNGADNATITCFTITGATAFNWPFGGAGIGCTNANQFITNNIISGRLDSRGESNFRD